MLFGSSGVRRKFGQELFDLSLLIGPSLPSTGGRILLGTDTRATGPVLKNLMCAGILGGGGNVWDAGIVPTPVIGWGARLYDLGVMITASHNPEEYNGLKIFNRDGSSISSAQQTFIEGGITNPPWSAWDHQGTLHDVDASTPYLTAVLESRTAVSDLSLFLDCGNGAGSVISPRLLSSQGAAVSCINCNTSGIFARPSEPIAENLTYIGTMVKEAGADGAVMHDGDADRMMAFDCQGRFISGDHLLMLFVKYLGLHSIVTTSDASMAIEEIATVRRTPVGDSFVSAELTKWGQFGGEPSGAWIFPEHSLCPDGPYAASLFCEIASEWDIAEEIDALPTYPIIRESLPCERSREILFALGAENPTDGIRIEEENGWCLIRASGTEPKIRLTAEGTNRMIAKTMIRNGRELLKKWKSA
ncbi:MAG: phosphopentomutase/phosphoglucosamine mutase [Methanoregulaceae archaeon]|nr:phosphopentomutase/phosphoglucosamine mutase [Methanoregulaceae archaeon]